MRPWISTALELVGFICLAGFGLVAGGLVGLGLLLAAVVLLVLGFVLGGE